MATRPAPIVVDRRTVVAGPHAKYSTHNPSDEAFHETVLSPEAAIAALLLGPVAVWLRAATIVSTSALSAALVAATMTAAVRSASAVTHDTRSFLA